MAQSVRDAAPKAVEEAMERVRRTSNEPLRATFMTRVFNAVARLAEDVDPWLLSDASSESSDYAVLFSVLNQPEALATLRRDDPLAEARLAGLRSRELLLQAEGGAIPADQAAALLGISRQAVDRLTSQLMTFHLSASTPCGSASIAVRTSLYSSDARVRPASTRPIRSLAHCICQTTSTARS